MKINKKEAGIGPFFKKKSKCVKEKEMNKQIEVWKVAMHELHHFFGMLPSNIWAESVTRLGDFLDFGQLLICPKIPRS